MPVILVFAFLLGTGATFAEPAIAVLKAAGAGVKPDQAPLLYSLLNDFSGQLVSSVGAGVGLAVMLGVLRFFFAWPLKYLAMPAVALLLGLSLYFSQIPELAAVLGLAWDCGAVIVGPVLCPLVLALGLGIFRATGKSDSSMAGFGIAGLISVTPIIMVIALTLFFSLVGTEPIEAPAAAHAAGETSRLQAIMDSGIMAVRAIAPVYIVLWLFMRYYLKEFGIPGKQYVVGKIHDKRQHAGMFKAKPFESKTQPGIETVFRQGFEQPTRAAFFDDP